MPGFFFWSGSHNKKPGAITWARCLILGALLSAFRKVFHASQALKIRVLRPHQGVALLRSCVNDAVGQWQLVACAQSCGQQGQARAKVNHAPLLHHRHILQRWPFASLLRYFFKNFKQCDGWHYQRVSRFNGAGEMLRIRLVGKVSQPG